MKSTTTKQENKNLLAGNLTGSLAPISNGRIAIRIQPLAIRNDCSAVGEWKIGESLRIGQKLDIAILKVGQYYGKLGRSTGQWLQIFFVPAPGCKTVIPEGTVCVTYIKTQSLSEFIAQLIMTPEPETKIWQAGFIPKENEKGRYHYVSLTPRERTEGELAQLEDIKQFLSQGLALYDPSLPDSMTSYADEAELQEAIAKTALLQPAEESLRG